MTRRLLLVLNDPVDYRLNRRPLVQAAAAAGWDVHVAGPEEPPAADIRADGVPWHALPIARTATNPLHDLRAGRALARLCRELQPGVLHLRANKAILAGGLALAMLPAAQAPACVAHFCGLGWLFSGGGLVRGIVRRGACLAMRRAARGPRCWTAVQTEADGAQLRAHGVADAGRIAVIAGSGVDCARFAPTPEPAGPLTVVLPARLLASKGVRDFAEAARLLSGSGLRLAIAGGPAPGNPDAVPEAEVRAWQAEGRLEWWGHRDDMPAVLASAHVVCFPSYYNEGIPKAVLEGAAAQRGLVAADLPGTRAVIDDGATGLIVPPRRPDAIAAALRRLQAEPELRRAMALAARRRAEERFALPLINHAFLALYDRLHP
jgi:glycosyltransferase involved in cell wall biosynthesis